MYYHKILSKKSEYDNIDTKEIDIYKNKRKLTCK